MRLPEDDTGPERPAAGPDEDRLASASDEVADQAAQGGQGVGASAGGSGGEAEQSPVDGDGPGDATKVEADLDALAEAEAKRDEYLELAKRAQADFDNYRKRMSAEVLA